MSRLVTRYRALKYEVFLLKWVVSLTVLAMIIIMLSYLGEFDKIAYGIYSLFVFLLLSVYATFYKIKRCSIYHQWIMSNPFLKKYITR